MKHNGKLWLALALALCLLLAGCSGGEADAAAQRFTKIEADPEGIVTIPTSDVTADARFYNYDADGVTVQIVTLRDRNNGVHAAFNTCQSCSPSPKAYYTQQGEVLQCTNCGFTFEPEAVGITHGGCNPMQIDGLEITADAITMPAASLKNMRPVFTTWEGPVK